MTNERVAVPTVGMEARARLSGGASHDAIYAAAAAALTACGAAGPLVDVGCGRGAIWRVIRDRFAAYVGVDAVEYEGFTRDARLVRADLERPLPLADGVAGTVISLETIEHLENPRAFVRELARIAAPGGRILVTTPNQLSALSLVTLVARQRFGAFQDVHYPAHRTALLEVDLRRIAAEAGLCDVAVSYTLAGRMPFTHRHFPRAVSRRSPRLFSDTVVLTARRPAAG
jgi:2-polyprenyl-3-methyl-5-hydroxy-6-metoxy-1,4-benzoquinol methylase